MCVCILCGGGGGDMCHHDRVQHIETEVVTYSKENVIFNKLVLFF